MSPLHATPLLLSAVAAVVVGMLVMFVGTVVGLFVHASRFVAYGGAVLMCVGMAVVGVVKGYPMLAITPVSALAIAIVVAESQYRRERFKSKDY